MKVTVPLARPVLGSHILISPDRSAETNNAPRSLIINSGREIGRVKEIRLCVSG